MQFVDYVMLQGDCVAPKGDPVSRRLAIGNLGDILPSGSISIGATGMSCTVIGVPTLVS